MIGGVNANKDAHSISAAEKEILTLPVNQYINALNKSLNVE